MRILILSTHFNTGGITSYVLSIAKGLVQKGHVVYVATSGGDRVSDLEKLGARHITVDIKTKSELSYKIYANISEIIKIVKKEKIDCLHAQTRVTQVLASLVSFFTNVPYVTTCHGFFKTRLSRKVFPCWGKAVIAISEQVCDHLVNDFGCPENRVFVVLHGLEEKKEIWSEKQKQDRRKILHLKSGVVIGMVARLSDVKGQDILIKAMAKVVERFKDVNLVLVGEGKFKDTLIALVKELSLSANVFFLPIINDQENILPLFDIFVMPSRQEGLGLSVMEAQAHGLPVIASDVGGLPTLVHDGKTGILFPKEDTDKLAKAIIRLIENPAKRNELGKAGQEFIRSNFSFEQMIDKTIDVYKSVKK